MPTDTTPALTLFEAVRDFLGPLEAKYCRIIDEGSAATVLRWVQLRPWTQRSRQRAADKRPGPARGLAASTASSHRL